MVTDLHLVFSLGIWENNVSQPPLPPFRWAMWLTSSWLSMGRNSMLCPGWAPSPPTFYCSSWLNTRRSRAGFWGPRRFQNSYMEGACCWSALDCNMREQWTFVKSLRAHGFVTAPSTPHPVYYTLKWSHLSTLGKQQRRFDCQQQQIFSHMTGIGSTAGAHVCSFHGGFSKRKSE